MPVRTTVSPCSSHFAPMLAQCDPDRTRPNSIAVTPCRRKDEKQTHNQSVLVSPMRRPEWVAVKDRCIICWVSDASFGRGDGSLSLDERLFGTLAE